MKRQGSRQPDAPEVKVSEITYDSEYAAWYLTTSKGRIARTRSIMEGRIMVNRDLDKKGRTLGIEIIGVKRRYLGKVRKLASLPPSTKLPSITLLGPATQL